MRFLTPLYWGRDQQFAGVVEFLIDPIFICQRVTAGVRSGQTGYAWIIDQNRISWPTMRRILWAMKP